MILRHAILPWAAGQEVAVIVLPAPVNAATSQPDEGEAAIQRILALGYVEFQRSAAKGL